MRKSGDLADSNPFRFSTKYQDGETDLLYYGHRYYSTSTGGWQSRDPVNKAGGVNLSRFVQNRPISRVDSDGRIDQDSQPATLPPAPSQSLPTSIRLCSRNIECDEFDIGVFLANMYGGHVYYDWPGGTATIYEKHKDGNEPVPEKYPDRARVCKDCQRNPFATLKYGPGKDTKAQYATEKEITECLKKRPIKGDYDGLWNNCQGWAARAEEDCGLSCPNIYYIPKK